MANLRTNLVGRRRALKLLALGASSSLLAACAPATQPGPTAAPAKPAEAKPTEAAKPAPAAATAPAVTAPTETLRLGAAVALTGPVSKEGNLVKDGYDVWMQTVNEQGGFDVAGKKHRVEIKFYDDESKADTA